MLYDFQEPLLRRDGTPMKAEVGSEKDATIGSVCILALDTIDMQSSKKVAGEEKYRRAHLADRIYGAKEPLKLEIEEVKLLKDLVGEYILSPSVVKVVWDFLDHPIAEEPSTPTPTIPSSKKE